MFFFFSLTTFKTISNIVKALIITQLLNVQFTSQDAADLPIFHEFKGICKYHNALVLYIL